MTILSKITGIFKRSKEPVVESTTIRMAKAQAKPAVMKIIDQAVGPGTRVWAFIGDLSLTEALYMVVGQEHFVVDLADNIFQTLIGVIQPYLPAETWIENIKADAQSFFPFLTLYFLLRLVSALLTGVSPAQFLMGLKSHSNPIWARVGGALRTLLEALFGPFIIFDLPALFSKRTLKEVITFTTLSSRNNMLRFFGAFVAIPCIFVLMLISPMFNNLEYLEHGANFSEMNLVPKKNKRKKRRNIEEVQTKEDNGPKTKEYQIQSELFLFNNNYTENDEILLIPDWQIEIQNKKKMVIPSFHAANANDSAQGEFRIFKLFDLNSVISVFENGNPLAFYYYPSITKWTHNKDVPNLKHNPNDIKLTTNQTAELEVLFERSFKLDLDHVKDLIIEQGPFIKGMMDVRQRIQDLLEVSHISEVQLYKIGKSSFLLIKGDSDSTHFIIPLNFSYGVIYRISWKAPGPRGNEFIQDFYRDFASNIEPRGVVRDVKHFAEDSVTLNFQSPMAILDLFFSKTMSNKEREIYNQYFYNYYYDLGTRALKGGEKKTIELVVKSLKRFQDMTVYLKKTDETSKIKLQTDIANLSNALNSIDKAYFGLEASASDTPPVEVIKEETVQ